jgi:hypothetical protein
MKIATFNINNINKRDASRVSVLQPLFAGLVVLGRSRQRHLYNANSIRRRHQAAVLRPDGSE